MASYYFAFVHEEYLREDNDLVREYYTNGYDAHLNDFVPINSGIDRIMYNYNTTLRMAVTICKSSLEPLFKNHIMLT